MDRVPINHIAQRLGPTAGAGIVPVIAPFVFSGVPWPAAVAASTVLMLSTALSRTVRSMLMEVLQHLRQVQQLGDQHQEAMFRERNQHIEVMQLLGKVNDAGAYDVDIAEVVEHIRVINPAATEPSSPQRAIRIGRRTDD